MYYRLSPHFPQNQIFMDVDTIEPGIDFVKVLEGHTDRVNAVAVIPDGCRTRGTERCGSGTWEPAKHSARPTAAEAGAGQALYVLRSLQVEFQPDKSGQIR
jgi:hypothetical protein